MRRKWAIIVAAVLGLLAVFLTNVYFRQREARILGKKVKEARVLVAAKEISRGATIDYDMLAFKAIPVSFVQPGSLTSRETVVGKAALVTIMAGEQILSTKLFAPGTGLTLAIKTPSRKRAMTVSLEAASIVGGMVRPGDHVDVLAILTTPPIILTLFQDVLILAVGQEMVAEGVAKRRWIEKAPSPREKSSITLALTPQEVQVLTVAMQHGKIRLTLRPRMEKGEALPTVDLSNLPPIFDLNSLLQLYMGRPQGAPQAQREVEVIRGLKKEIISVPKKR